MELTIDQALQKGVEAHKAGQVQEADRLYTAILQSQPKHPDANHNMGVLAVGVGKAQEALPFFKTALEANPSTAQFWLSYIDALIKLERLADAQAVFDQAKSNGAKGDGFDQLEQRLEAVKLPTSMTSNTQDPPQDQFQTVVNLYRQKHLQEALHQTEELLQQFPSSVILHNISGAATRELGQLSAAISAYQKAIDIQPDFAEAYNNLGNALKEYGKLDEAVESFKKALSLKYDYAEAYSNMSLALTDQGQFEAAIESCKSALLIKPNFAEAYDNMGIALKKQGKLEKALKAYNNAVTIKPDYANAHYNMGNALKEQGMLEEAIEAYNKTLNINPGYAEARHMVSALSGKTTSSAPREYVEKLFDNYAAEFECSLVKQLDYHVPRNLAGIILDQQPDDSIGSVLDLGCGTGLFGSKIKKFCDNLEGIDLSEPMLKEAKHKGVYDKLTHSDIVNYLLKSNLDFDYFIATDVFVYIGNLSEIFKLIKLRNQRAGKLAFSTEHAKKDGFYLQKTGRYSHSTSYIDDLCKEFKFTISHFSISNLRKEKGVFLTGGLYVLDF